MKYQVTYEATYYVDALDEDDAIYKAIEQHGEDPDGSWEAVQDPYASPLEQLADGTYIQGASGLEDLIAPLNGYWVGTVPVQAVSDVPLGAYLGVWTDPEDGTRYYDIAEYRADLDKALEIAHRFGQISIWDIKNSKAIPVTS
jgi:hypothetical protein